MNYGLHLLKTPTNKIVFVGTIPMNLMDGHEPTQSDVMAGRVYNGKAYKSKRFDRAIDAVNAAKDAGAELCANVNCACFKLRNEGVNELISEVSK